MIMHYVTYHGVLIIIYNKSFIYLVAGPNFHAHYDAVIPVVLFTVLCDNVAVEFKSL